MTAGLSRNAPCHCGSGKKYKRCHLAADEERLRVARAAVHTAPALLSPPPADLPPLPLPPHGRKADALPVLPAWPAAAGDEEDGDGAADAARWEAFAAAMPDERVRLFAAALEGDDLDPDTAFDMLDTLHADAVAAGDRGRFRALVGRLRARHPAVYAADRIWHLSWLIEDAAAEGAYDLLPPLTAELVEAATDDLDELFRLIDVLAFHGQVEPLIDLLERARPVVQRDAGLLPSAAAEYDAILAFLYLFRHLDGGGAPRADDPALAPLLTAVGNPNAAFLQRALDALDGRQVRRWTAEDFRHGPHDEGTDVDDDGGDDLDRPDRRDTAVNDHGDEPDPCDVLAENLTTLSLELVGRLHRERGLPLSRLEVGRESLVRYVLRLPPGKDGAARLLPDRRSVEAQVAALLGLVGGSYFRAGVFYALLPPYVDLVLDHGLVKRDAARRARAEVLGLREHVARIVREGTADPHLEAFVWQAGE
jgi:hypothetical protein